MEENPVLFTQHQGIATLTLNRPQVRNAFDETSILQLMQYLHQIQEDDTIHVLVFKGKGEHFCAGADINWMRRMAKLPQENNRRDAEKLAQLLYTLNHLNKPTLALVQGSVFGGGIGIIACCDIVIGQPDTIFCFSEVKLGLVPAVVSPYVIAAMGVRAARRYMLSAETFNAEQARDMHLIHEIKEATFIEARLNEIIHKIFQNGPQALSTTKELIRALAEEHRSPLQQLAYTAELIADVRKTKEAQEGLSAFLEKREPLWQED